MRYMLIAGLLLIGCTKENQKKVQVPVPFKINLLGQDLFFPVTVGQIVKTQHAVPTFDGQLKDSTTAMNTIWYYDWHKFPVATTPKGAAVPMSAPIYGVIFMIKDKASHLDSLKKVIEDKQRLVFKPFQTKALDLDKEFLYSTDLPVITSTPKSGVRISIREASCQKGDYPYPCGQWESSMPPSPDNPGNYLRVAISFGLTPIEEERFVLGDGRIWERKD